MIDHLLSKTSEVTPIYNTGASRPLVSIILTTKNRPNFLKLALRFYREQKYEYKELIIVDDSDEPFNLDSYCETDPVHYIYLPTPYPLGTKLNIGIDSSKGEFLLKMDDDDFYSEDFLEQMVATSLNRDYEKSISFLQPFLLLYLRNLEIRVSDRFRCSGATLFFHRRYWERCPFRDIPSEVDAVFLNDHGTTKDDPATLNQVKAIESFLQVRHKNHLWNFMPDGMPLEAYLSERPLYHKTLKELVPKWAFNSYRKLSSVLRASLETDL